MLNYLKLKKYIFSKISLCRWNYIIAQNKHEYWPVFIDVPHDWTVYTEAVLIVYCDGSRREGALVSHHVRVSYFLYFSSQTYANNIHSRIITAYWKGSLNTIMLFSIHSLCQRASTYSASWILKHIIKYFLKWALQINPWSSFYLLNILLTAMALVFGVLEHCLLNTRNFEARF